MGGGGGGEDKERQTDWGGGGGEQRNYLEPCQSEISPNKYSVQTEESSRSSQQKDCESLPGHLSQLSLEPMQKVQQE